MSDRGRHRPVVIAEHTPNPDCVKLVVPSLEEPGAGVDVPRGDAERISSLAARLYRLDGLERVLVGPGFVALTRRRGAPWDRLAPAATEILRRQVERGERWLVKPPRAPRPAEAPEGADSERVRELLERQIRPAVQAHGGDVALVEVRGGVVEVSLRGACAGCPSALRTLRAGIESSLRAAIPEVERVVCRDL
ncbi:MAG: NifU family protein [Myxococcota bacterium]